MDGNPSSIVLRITLGRSLLAPGFLVSTESIIVLRCDYQVLGFVKHPAPFRITELLADGESRS